MSALIKVYLKEAIDKPHVIKIDDLAVLDKLALLLPTFRDQDVIFIGHRPGNGIRHSFYNTEEIQAIELDISEEMLEELKEFNKEDDKDKKKDDEDE